MFVRRIFLTVKFTLMKTAFLFLAMFPFSLFAQDCTLYHVKVTFKGAAKLDSLVEGKIKFPQIAHIKDYKSEVFDEKTTKDEFNLSENFRVSFESLEYDFYLFEFTNSFLPLKITTTDVMGKVKSKVIKIPRNRIDFKFYRERDSVELIFNLGEFSAN